MSEVMLRAEGVAKSFTLHLQGGVTIPLHDGVGLPTRPGECLALAGPSGAGKSTLMRSLHGNYGVDGGRILVRHDGGLVNLADAAPRTVLDIRRRTLGYVSQFLRTVPRVSTLDIVAEPAVARGVPPGAAREAAAALLHRLRIPARLHALPPATFSGGEQQRVNLARGFVAGHPVLLLDEPTASLDPANTATVVSIINEAKARGAAIVGIFHDGTVRDSVADAILPVTTLQDAA